MQGYVDPITKKFVKTAGNASISNIPVASEESAGLMSTADKKKINEAYTSSDVASSTTILNLFNS